MSKRSQTGTSSEPPAKKVKLDTSSQDSPSWSKISTPSKEDITNFTKRSEVVNKRTATKTQYLLKLAPHEPNKELEAPEVWRKISIQTSLALNDVYPHRFVMPNGLEVGKVEKNVRLNERTLKVSQLLPTTQYWVYYDYGNMFRWKLSVELIKPQDSLPAPRLCAGKGVAPEESIRTLDEFREYLATTENEFEINDVNSIFLGTQKIQMLSGFRNSMKTKEDERNFQLAQMCTFPGSI
eukprot:TRINITY_DN6489_c0_g1_i3.p1 TRINITY_DN6489_c0_g1~~TRINITY_DN6489_c0_g1_i3.p1  ORF type:complete len:238 (-),score=54.54 TRINITY_DN6489_c0_g1_i3:51-764(-)